jgi:small-conductance mechanosensitive channel
VTASEPIIGLSERSQRLLTRLLQAVRVGICLAGLVTLRLGMAANGAFGLALTLIPAAIRREYNYTMSPALVLWITIAVVLHTVGALGPYTWFAWFDSLTHTVSATVVAGLGYATFRGFEQHSEALEVPASFRPVFVVVFGGYYLSAVVVRLLGRPVARRFRRPSLTRTVLRSVRGLVLGFAALVVLWIVGLRAGDIVLSVTVFSAVLGIVLAPIVGSLISGLFVLADQPYEIGDLIELTDVDRRGYVEDITLRYTKIFTLDNTFLVLPNSSIRERDVINFSAEDERTRLTLPLVVTYESDVNAAREVMERAGLETPEVIDGGPDIRIGSARYPAAPTCYIDEYGDHGVRLLLRYWVKTPYYLTRVQSKVNERVWDGLADADVEIAYPHSHLVFDETSGHLSVDLDEAGGRGVGERAGGSGGEPRSP